MELNSHIFVCRDLDVLSAKIEENYSKYNLKVFKSDDFLIDDAKAIIKEAYIAESQIKIIATIAKSYNIYAQNSLLKILEEPPRNIIFIICAPTKNVLLPTIRSRLGIKFIKTNENQYDMDINFKKLDIQTILNFLEDKKFLDKNLTKNYLQQILTQALTQDIVLDEKEIDIFPKMLHLAELNSRSHYLLLTALLTIYNGQGTRI